jgi:hypothetical protein
VKDLSKYVLVVVLAGFGLMTAQPASAQAVPKTDVSAGWQFQHFSASDCTGNGCSDNFPAGWYFDVSGGIMPMVSVVGAVDGSYKSDAFSATGFSVKVHSFLGGVRFSSAVSPTLTPYGQVLVGLVSLKGSGGGEDFTDNAFGLDLGGGVNVPVSGAWGVRAGIDYRRGFFKSDSDVGGGVNVFRFLAGVVYTLP